MSNVADQLLTELKAAGERLGKSFSKALDDQRQYISRTMLELSAAVSEPGFDEAVIAARDSIAMHAGIAAADEGDVADAELRGILSGGLAIAARALARA